MVRNKVGGVGEELAVQLCDPRAADPPAGWAQFVRSAPLHAVWHWPVMRTLAVSRRGAVIAAVLRDGDRVTGLVSARLLGLGRRGPGIADVECPGSMSLPGLALPGG